MEISKREGTGDGLLAAAHSANGTVGGSQPGGHHVLEFTERELATLGLTKKDLPKLGLTEKDLANLLPTSVVTSVGGPYCPKPNSDQLLGGYKTLVEAIEHLQMREIKKTDYIKKIHYENQTIDVPKTSIEMDRIEHKDQVVVVRKVAKKIPKTFYRVVEEVREVTEMVDVVDYIDVPWIEEVPRYVIQKTPKTIPVPVLEEEPVPSTVVVPTGKFCKYSVDHFNFVEVVEPKPHDSNTGIGTLLPKPNVVTDPLLPNPSVVTEPLPPNPSVITKPLPPNPNVVTEPLPPNPNVVTEPLPPNPNVVTEPLPPNPNVVTEPLPPNPNVVTEPLPPNPNVVTEPVPPNPNVVTEPLPPNPNVITEPSPPNPNVITEPLPPNPNVITEPSPPNPKIDSTDDIVDRSSGARGVTRSLVNEDAEGSTSSIQRRRLRPLA